MVHLLLLLPCRPSSFRTVWSHTTLRCSIWPSISVDWSCQTSSFLLPSFLPLSSPDTTTSNIASQMMMIAHCKHTATVANWLSLCLPVVVSQAVKLRVSKDGAGDFSEQSSSQLAYRALNHQRNSTTTLHARLNWTELLSVCQMTAAAAVEISRPYDASDSSKLVS